MNPTGSIWEKLVTTTVLAMAAPVASRGFALGCYVRNKLTYSPLTKLGLPHRAVTGDGIPIIANAGRIPGASLSDLFAALIMVALMVIWGIAMLHIFRRYRTSPVALALLVIPLAAFAFGAWMTVRFAYPVCNPF